jgi:hypothetical protein
MPRRAATVTQADVSRTIRAMKAEGLIIVRCVTRADGVVIETVAAPAQCEVADAATTGHSDKPKVVL